MILFDNLTIQKVHILFLANSLLYLARGIGKFDNGNDNVNENGDESTTPDPSSVKRGNLWLRINN